MPAGRPEQVRESRRRVLAAARELFLRRGYGGATIEAVAHRAGVSPQTVYNVVGGKTTLVKAVYDVMLAGDDEPIPMSERPAAHAVRDAPDGRTALARYAASSRDICGRVGPLIPVIFTERELRPLVDTLEDERARGTAAVAAHVAQRFGLRAGLSVPEAADLLWALTAPELFDRLVRRRGWSLDRYEWWLAGAMPDALLGPASR